MTLPLPRCILAVQPVIITRYSASKIVLLDEVSIEKPYEYPPGMSRFGQKYECERSWGGQTYPYHPPIDKCGKCKALKKLRKDIAMAEADPGKASRVAGKRYKRTLTPLRPVRVETWTGKKWHCEHDKQRTWCKACGGNSICEHGNHRTRCKACRGGKLGGKTSATVHSYEPYTF